jgi:hypothetical protein
VLDRQRLRRDQNAVRVEDVIPAEILAGVGQADRDYLEQVFRDPQRFLPPRAPDSSESERNAEPGESADPESKFSRRAKLAGLIGAGALVAGAVVVAPMLPGAHRAAPDTTGDPAPAGFLGAAELGGAAVPQQQSHPAPDANDSPHGVTHEDPVPAVDRSSGAAGARQAPPAAAAPNDRPARSAAEKLAAIERFYASIARHPDDALSLLTPGLAGGAAGELVRTWSSMDAIDLQEQDTRVQPDGSILAVATLQRPDGQLVRVTQLFRVADGTGLITDAELLSAQYM